MTSKRRKKVSRPPTKKVTARKFILFIFSFFSVFVLFYLFYLVAIITEHFEGRRWDVPSRIYSDSFTIYPGMNLAKSGFFKRLRRLSYVLVDQSIENPGEYFYNRKILEIYFHDFETPTGKKPERLIRMELKDGIISSMVNLSYKKEIFIEHLEPEIISEFFGKAREERVLVSMEEVPDYLKDAVVAIEDHRFFEHKGVDLRAIFRAFFANLRAGGVTQGGSTLTQQLVKNFFLTSERSYRRKFNEALMSLIVEKKYSKEEILGCYLNEIYFGQRGSVAIHGVGEASKYYFGKQVSRLNLAESAMLAGIIKGPGIYSPYRHFDKAKKRQEVVLNRMLDNGKVF